MPSLAREQLLAVESMNDPERQRQEELIKRVLGSLSIGQSFYPIGMYEILIVGFRNYRLGTCSSSPGHLQQSSTCLRPRVLCPPSLLHWPSIQRCRSVHKLKLTPSYRETGFQLLRTSCVFHMSRHSARSCSGGKWSRRGVQYQFSSCVNQRILTYTSRCTPYVSRR